MAGETSSPAKSGHPRETAPRIDDASRDPRVRRARGEYRARVRSALAPLYSPRRREGVPSREPRRPPSRGDLRRSRRRGRRGVRRPGRRRGSPRPRDRGGSSCSSATMARRTRSGSASSSSRVSAPACARRRWNAAAAPPTAPRVPNMPPRLGTPDSASPYQRSRGWRGNASRSYADGFFRGFLRRKRPARALCADVEARERGEGQRGGRRARSRRHPRT